MLTNVEGYDEAELFRAVHAFFTQVPEAERRKLVWRNHCPENSNYYRGLTPFVGNDAAHKEMLDMGGDLSLVSDENLKYALYEDTPFPP
jgi:isopenicillin N synthase-like dioxygenase